MPPVLLESPRLWSSTRIHGSALPEAGDLNDRLREAFARLRPEDFSRRTHFFGGRYENLYLERGRLPELEPVLNHAEACARRILDYGTRALRLGFWFNAQGPGQGTTEHIHDEDDEQLSGVYYVHVPRESGDLILLDGALTLRFTPRAGQFLFFPPALAHRVEVNRSPFQRLSIAFNLGPGEAAATGAP